MKKFWQIIFCALLIASFASCREKRVISRAGQALEFRQYEDAMKEILALDDKAILKSDTLMEMLSNAYYDLTLTKANGVAYDCYDMDFSADGKTVALTDFGTESVKIFSFPDLMPKKEISLPTKPYNSEFHSGDKVIGVALLDGTIRLYDIATGKEVHKIESNRSAARDAVVIDDNVLVTCGNDQRLRAINALTGEVIWEMHPHKKNIKDLALSKDRTRIVTASNDGSTSVIKINPDYSATEVAHIVHNVENYVNAAAITPDNNTVITVSGDGVAKIWSVATEKTRHEIPLNTPLCSVDISDDGRYALVGGMDKVYMLDMETGKILLRMDGNKRSVTQIMFTDDGGFAYVDKLSISYGKLLTGQALIDAAREYQNKNTGRHNR